MDLILWRHADAQDGLPDQARELAPSGREQAARMAPWLDRHLPADTAILVSPAVRTRQTADALVRPYRVEAAVGTRATPAGLLEAAGWPHAAGAVLVVGHQPTLGRVAALLLAGQDLDWEVRRANVWWITGVCYGRTVDCTLRALMAPELLA